MTPLISTARSVDEDEAVREMLGKLSAIARGEEYLESTVAAGGREKKITGSGEHQLMTNA